ncbi:3-deoxy-7-phosphoheptulonate synthase [Candidatus Haliotispira prima]|uniref:Phospho-2-dehydro-3-deoxyheptonate aldolase n=1 Tax=Candidatus Haliotispira prima TaxID=3034016 RepID=A0ABY8MJK7_9SPIO|nr:3-deoxy-7-phosphoheptulonate synthase [Candidatus Haliotispira prima]
MSKQYSTSKIENINILHSKRLKAPIEYKKEHPSNPKLIEHVRNSREAIVRLLNREDQRLMVITGPCSIHDYDLAMEYAHRLKKLADEVAEHIMIVMRVYFEKPRTVKGWRGLIIDPHLDGSNDMVEGLRLARKILLDINDIGLPAATEVLDPIVPQFISDLISWAAIGARTTESQIHRELSSGLSMPVGFKNSTDGSFVNSINGMEAAFSGHTFLGVDEDGELCLLDTKGNKNAHLILRGGNSGPNHDAETIRQTVLNLEKRGLPSSIIVDCSHSNSDKDFGKQPEVCRNVLTQFMQGQKAIRGVMLESNIHSGRQDVPSKEHRGDRDPKSLLQYGVSLTDGCIDWDCTEELIRETFDTIRRGEKNYRDMLPRI